MSSNSRLYKCPNNIKLVNPEEKEADIVIHAVTQGPMLREAHAWSNSSVFIFLIFGQGAQHFNFSLGPVNYVAGPE